MIVGIGNDIIEIERVEKAISKEGFIAKVYTQREIENIVKRGNRTETYAGIFSAKEAISKAIGTGVREFALTDLEILNEGNLDLKIDMPNIYQIGYELVGFLDKDSDELNRYINICSLKESRFMATFSKERKENKANS